MSTDVTGADEALVVHQFPSGKRGEIRAYFQPYEGELLAHIRRYEPRSKGNYAPTKKGIAVRPHELNDLLIAVVKLVAAPEATDG